jgi:uncharacterized protein (DUF111 family)
MNTLYFDCSLGLSGPMIVGALCDLGVKPSALEWELSQVDLGEFHTHFERVTADGMTGVKFNIHAGETHTADQDEPAAAAHQHEHALHEHGHEHHEHDGDCGDVHDHHSELPHRVDKLIASIGSSELSDPVKVRATSVLARLGQTHDALSLDEAAAVICASAALHVLKPERVAFFCREGTMDATVDSGAAFAAEFVSSSAPMPSFKSTGEGRGFGSDGQAMRAVLADVAV